MDERPIPLPAGTRAPDFALPNSAHASVSLRDFRGRRVVLAFYPADREPVSREQLALYGGCLPAFRDLRTGIVGISTDGIWSHVASAREVGIRFPLLSDSHPKDAVARDYGVCPERKGSSSRALVVVDERGSFVGAGRTPAWSAPGWTASCAPWSRWNQPRMRRPRG